MPAKISEERRPVRPNQWTTSSVPPLHVLHDALMRKHTIYTQRWKSSQYRKLVDEFFEKIILRQTFTIDRAICLGLNSLLTSHELDGDE